jgi:hypothetical protein
VPGGYHWEIFIIGELFVLAAMILILRRARHGSNRDKKNNYINTKKKL